MWKFAIVHMCCMKICKLKFPVMCFSCVKIEFKIRDASLISIQKSKIDLFSHKIIGNLFESYFIANYIMIIVLESVN